LECGTESLGLFNCGYGAIAKAAAELPQSREMGMLVFYAVLD
jgi:hypothetical protein